MVSAFLIDSCSSASSSTTGLDVEVGFATAVAPAGHRRNLCREFDGALFDFKLAGAASPGCCDGSFRGAVGALHVHPARASNGQCPAANGASSGRQGSGGAAWCNPYLSDCRAVFDFSASTSARPKPLPMFELLNRLEVDKARSGWAMDSPPQRGAMMRVRAGTHHGQVSSCPPIIT